MKLDRQTIRRLELLSQEAERAATAYPDNLAALQAEFTRLREEAWALAQDQGWTTKTEFDVQFPSVPAMASISTLNEQFNLPSPGSDPTVRASLRELAAWAIGVRMAGELQL